MSTVLQILLVIALLWAMAEMFKIRTVSAHFMISHAAVVLALIAVLGRSVGWI